MQRLKNRDHCPPDGFRWLDPDSGFEIKAIDIHTWLSEIAAHRKANGYPPVTEEQAVGTLCETLPPGWCQHHNPNKFVSTRLRWGDIVEGAKAYVALIASGFQTVSQEEADRRARVCSGCYLKAQPQGCGSCVKMARLIVTTFAGKKTAHEDRIKNMACAPCKCPLSSVVWFPMSALEKPEVDSPEKQTAYPDFCWRKQGGVNYLPDNV